MHLDFVDHVDATQRLDQRCLAGVVVAEYADAFVGVLVEIDVSHRDQAAESLDDLPHLDERLAVRCLLHAQVLLASHVLPRRVWPDFASVGGDLSRFVQAYKRFKGHSHQARREFIAH